MSRLGTALAVSASFGFVVGGLTVAGVYELYPPAKGDVWPIPTLAVASVVVVLLLYVIAARLGVLRVGDWIVLGYAGALVLAASVVMTREVVGTLRAHVPENLGVKTSLVPSNGADSDMAAAVVRSRAGSTPASCAWLARSGPRLIPPWATRSASSSRPAGRA